MFSNARSRLPLALACAAIVGCAADATTSSTTPAGGSSGQAVCDTRASGICSAYPGHSAAQQQVCAQSGGEYRVPSVCYPSERVGTCACADVGQGLGAATLTLYAPTFTCLTAKAGCTRACNGTPGTFNGGC